MWTWTTRPAPGTARDPRSLLEATAKAFLGRLAEKRHRDFFGLLIREAPDNALVRNLLDEAVMEKIRASKDNQGHGAFPEPQCRAAQILLHQFSRALVAFAAEKRLWHSRSVAGMDEGAYVSQLCDVFARDGAGASPTAGPGLCRRTREQPHRGNHDPNRADPRLWPGPGRRRPGRNPGHPRRRGPYRHRPDPGRLPGAGSNTLSTGSFMC